MGDSYSSSMPSPSTTVYVDLYGKRRQVAKVQVLEREIRLLQDEIKSLAELELASRCCKELDDYIEATPDPLVTMNQIRGRSRNCQKNSWRKIGSILRCFSCCPRAKDCCWDCQQETYNLGCRKISCLCSCNTSCPKRSVCCCCNPCPCF